jgi:putative hydrolase of the HAD superfamily
VPAYRAVVFDFFGTLTCSVRRGPQHADIARDLGCYSRARGTFGSAEATLRWVTEQAGGHPQLAQLQAAVPARVDALKADTRLRSDAVSTLAALKDHGIRTAIVSDCTHELPAFLPSLPIAPLLDALVFSVEVGICKPDPAIYLAACEKLGVAPDECIYVGDGGSHELSGAVAVGMTAFRLAAPDLADHLVFDEDTEFTGPSIESLSEILPLLTRIPALV